MSKLAMFFFLFLIPISAAFAEEVTMTSEQSDYYFKTGDNAVIPVEIENTSGKAISGTLQYTITQDIQQGNTRISNTNSNFSTLTAEEGKKTISLDFGTFNSPATLTANLKFNYNNGNEMNIFLGPIKIIFVEDSSKMNNSSSPIQSSSQQGTSQQSNQMSPQQSLKQKLDDMLNQSPLSQDPQQRLQNNQLAQDSSTLKQEIQKQLQKDNQLQAELEKKITSDPEFQKLHQQMLNQGYELKKGSLNPVTNSTGTFEANYENQDGKWGKIEGTMTNGTMTDIQMQTQEHQENLLAQLRVDPTFQEYQKQLNQEGFSEQNFSISSDANQTSVLIEFQDKDSKEATITGKFVNDELVEVKLDKPKSQFDILPFLMIGLVSVAAAVFLIKLRPRKKLQTKEIPIPAVQKFDYVSEAAKLLEKSKEEFKNQRYQDAYSFLGQAIRLFLSYKFELKKEITNEELFDFLKDPSYPVDAIKNYLNHSTLVEFAKDSPDKNEFENMIILTESLFKK